MSAITGVADHIPVCTIVGTGTRGPWALVDSGAQSILLEEEDHLLVRRIAASGAVTTLTRGVHYDLTLTVDGTGFSTAQISLRLDQSVLAAASGATPAERLVAYREQSATQQFTTAVTGRFSSQDFVEAQNRLMLLLQELRSRADRAPLMPPGDGGYVAPEKLQRRGMVLGFDVTTGALGAYAVSALSTGAQLITEFELTGDGTVGPYTVPNVLIPSPAAVLIWVGGSVQPVDAYALSYSGEDTLITFGSAVGLGVSIVGRVIGYLEPIEGLAMAATSRLLGRVSAGAGPAEELTAAQVKTLLAIAQADVAGLTTASSPTFAGATLGSGNLTLSNVNPLVIFDDTNGGTNAKRARLIHDGGVFRLQFYNDDNTSFNDVFNVTRTGSTPNLTTFNTGLIATAQASDAVAVGVLGRASDNISVLRWVSNAGSTEYARLQVNSSAAIAGFGSSGAGVWRWDASGIQPTSNDGASVGNAFLQWSDLFLASGAVINANNGNATITHSAGRWAVNVPWGLASYTVAGLPSGSTGDMAYASNGRKNGEGAGLGTGVLVFKDGTAWRACDTGATVAA